MCGSFVYPLQNNQFIMKLGFKKLAFLGALSFLALAPISNASASVYLPANLTLPGNPTTETPFAKATAHTPAVGIYATYDAGTTQVFDITYSEEKINPNTIFEYGVVREIREGNLTYYETLSTTKLEGAQAKKTLEVVIPNITAQEASSTYVGYVKTYTKDDPDSEHFYVTKSFAIKPNSAPFLNIKYSNLLQSTGKRFVAQAGPSIYNPAKESGATLATSTALEITFESNQDTTISPVLDFSMLRTGDFAAAVEIGEIAIKKGETHIVIPLPTFDYKPGVYVGKADFKSDLLKNTIDFQYIVAGDTVTIGQTMYTEQKAGSLFTYNIFGTPIDIDRLEELRNSPKSTLYNVTLSYVKNGKEVFNEVKDVDFSTSTFTSLVPSKVKKIDQVHITVTSKTSNEVVYSGTKDLYVERAPNIVLNFVISLILLALMILILALAKKHHNKLAVTALFLFALLGFAQVTFAWEPSNFVVTSIDAGFANENVYENPRMFLNENISTKTYAIGDPLTLLFKLSYVYCSNTGVGLYAGLSKISMAEAGNQISTRNATAESMTSFGNGGNHTIYRNITGFMSANLGNIAPTTTHVYAVVSEDIIAPSSRVTDGATSYAIPLRIGPATPVLTAETSAQCGGKIDLRWSAIPGAVRYDIYRGINGTFTKVGSTASALYSSSVGSYGATFTFMVKAVSASGIESGFSNIASAESSETCDETSLEFSCEANPISVGLGQNVNWGITMRNGSPNAYDFDWSGSVNSSSREVSTSYSSEGVKYATVVATNKNDGTQLTADCYTEVTSVITCDSGEDYCSSLGECVESGDSCPISCGSVSENQIPQDTPVTSGTAGLCGGSYSLLPGSIFSSLGGGNALNAWRWTCSTNNPSYESRVSCSADCAAGTTYCPTTNTCSTECEICPEGYTANALGECIAPNASIRYFRANPNISSSTCPGFWDTTVTPSNKVHLDCRIGTAPVSATNVTGSTGYPLTNGTLHTLSCDLVTNKNNTFIKTIASSTRCFRPIDIIED